MENMENEENKKYDESRIYYVYKHVRLDNNTCFYIGKGKEGRLNVPNRNTIHDNICKKHGYKAVIFKDKLNEEEAFKLEKDLINCYVSKLGYGIYIKGYYVNTENNKFLTNMTFGGEGTSGIKLSEQTKRNMSESHKGRKNSEEHNKNISKATKGENNPMYGKRHSEESKQKMSESQKGKKHHMHDKGKKVICITTGKIFNKQSEASNYYNVVLKNISCCCRGTRKSAGKLPNGTKLQWRFLKNYDNEFKGILINPITEEID